MMTERTELNGHAFNPSRQHARFVLRPDTACEFGRFESGAGYRGRRVL